MESRPTTRGVRLCALAAAAALVGLVIVDALSERTILISALVVVPLIASLRCPPRAVAGFGLVALAAALALAAIDDIFLSERHLVGLGVILSGTVVAAAASRSRWELARLRESSQAAEVRLQTIIDNLAEAVTITDRAGDIVYVNEAAVRLAGTGETLPTRENVAARTEMLDEDGRPFDRSRFPGDRALAGEDPGPVTVLRRDLETGEERWLTVKATAIPDPLTGEPALAVSLIEDVTEQRRAHETAAFLAEASKLLASSLDYERTLAALADAAVPRVADRCVITLDDELTVAAGEETEIAVTAPLTSGDRAIGTIGLGFTGSRRATDTDRELAEELGRRAGIAADNARIHRERSRIAATLQRSLLPPRLPVIPGITLAARFRAAGEANQVGGDFYDLFPVGDGWMMVIGDVTGKGPGAAAITSLARYTIRTAAMYESAPEGVLRRLNEALLADGDAHQMCTAVCLRITPSRDGAPIRVELVCAGHPPPYLVRRPGHLEELCRPGPLLGAFSRAEWQAFEIELQPGDGVVLYTDGVTDARGAGGLFGQERLEAALREAAGTEADAIAETIDEALLGFQEGPQRDDVALLVLRAAAPDDAPETTVVAGSSTVGA